MPLRIRLTLAFALAMAIVLGATGFFLYARLGATLDRTIRQGLRARAADVAALVQQSDSGLSEARGSRRQEESFAQVLDLRGRVVDATPELGTRPLLTAQDLARAGRDPIFIDLAGEAERLLATPVRAQDQLLVVVVGATLAPRAEALAGLRGQLLVGGPIALLLASLVGYALARAALRPVEAMRLRAQAISAGGEGQRLPVPRARDEIARLGETLNEMLARLELALERERSFVSDASHELRSPLALLKTEIELALDQPRTAEELRSALRSAGEETDRLVQLAEDLLLLARADKGALPIRAAPIAVRDLFADLAARFGRRVADAGRRIESSAPASCSIVGDRLRLEQGLANLVDNALRQGAGTIELVALEREAEVELHVTDRGAGFPAAFLAQAFDRFSRADEARGRGGAGLGLAIVAAIAKAHGGAAHAANRPEGGADVWFTVPRHAA